MIHSLWHSALQTLATASIIAAEKENKKTRRAIDTNLRSSIFSQKFIDVFTHP